MMAEALPMEYVKEKSRRIFQRLGPYFAPIFLIPHRGAGPGEITHNATAGLLNVGDKSLIVTCCHVWREFEQQRGSNTETTLCIAVGNSQRCIALDDVELIDSEDALDLVLLEPANASLIESTGKQFYSDSRWPHRHAEAGERILFIGYPGRFREPTADGVMFNAALIVDFAYSVNDRNFLLVDHDLGREEQAFLPGLPKVGVLGGLSGSPAFVNRGKSLNLVGFVSDSSVEGNNATFLISHAAFIKDDGTLDRLAMPWLQLQ